MLNLLLNLLCDEIQHCLFDSTLIGMCWLILGQIVMQEYFLDANTISHLLHLLLVAGIQPVYGYQCVCLGMAERNLITHQLSI